MPSLVEIRRVSLKRKVGKILQFIVSISLLSGLRKGHDPSFTKTTMNLFNLKMYSIIGPPESAEEILLKL